MRAIHRNSGHNNRGDNVESAHVAPTVSFYNGSSSKKDYGYT